MACRARTGTEINKQIITQKSETTHALSYTLSLSLSSSLCEFVVLTMSIYNATAAAAAAANRLCHPFQHKLAHNKPPLGISSIFPLNHNALQRSTSPPWFFVPFFDLLSSNFWQWHRAYAHTLTGFHRFCLERRPFWTRPLAWIDCAHTQPKQALEGVCVRVVHRSLLMVLVGTKSIFHTHTLKHSQKRPAGLNGGVLGLSMGEA